jgi:hypothetical protein
MTIAAGWEKARLVHLPLCVPGSGLTDAVMRTGAFDAGADLRKSHGNAPLQNRSDQQLPRMRQSFRRCKLVIDTPRERDTATRALQLAALPNRT